MLLTLASCGQPTVDSQIDWTKIACLDKAVKVFPALKTIADKADQNNGNEITSDNSTAKEMGQFRFVSTGKFIWDWQLEQPLSGKVTCTGDFNLQRIETLNYNGLDKRPSANEVWKIE